MCNNLYLISGKNNVIPITAIKSENQRRAKQFIFHFPSALGNFPITNFIIIRNPYGEKNDHNC